MPTRRKNETAAECFDKIYLRPAAGGSAAVPACRYPCLLLVLGSWYALIAFGFYPVIIIVRLTDEEKLLTKELPGYEAYKKKVRYRLIPFIW